MANILCLNKISPIGTDRLGENYNFSTEMENPQGILVRSASMHDMELDKDLLAVARAGAGVNNIPVEKCSQEGVVVFNTPGANANAVKELVVASLFLSSRKIIDGSNWANTLKQEENVSKLVEKGKSAFAGPEVYGKSLGVIGLGAIGILVANAASKLGMTVYGYDPFLSVKSAWGLSSHINYAPTLDDIYANCDYITIHVPLNKDTKDLVSKDSIAKMKDNVRILNFARGELVNSNDIIEALEQDKVACYVTDFPDSAVIGVKNVIAIPHLGASTPESEDNCAIMAVDQLKEYLETGNITNSVNMPNISLAKTADCARICIFHKNVPNTIGSFAAVCADMKLNIENMISKAKGDFAYTILDISGDMSHYDENLLTKLSAIVRVRLLK